MVIPLRAFHDGKSRLAPNLSPTARAALLRWMAERVVSARGPLPVAIVSSASDVCQWAAQYGLDLIDDPGTLDEAAERGMAWALQHGHERIIIAHADIPFARGFDRLAGHKPESGIFAVRSHRGAGTPVLSLPVGLAFQFSYGEGSFQRHELEASRLDVKFHVVDDATLAFDVDSIDDLLIAKKTAAKLQREP